MIKPYECIGTSAAVLLPSLAPLSAAYSPALVSVIMVANKRREGSEQHEKHMKEHNKGNRMVRLSLVWICFLHPSHSLYLQPMIHAFLPHFPKFTVDSLSHGFFHSLSSFIDFRTLRER